MSDQTRRPTVERPKPGRVWYAVAALIALGGIVAAGFFIYGKLDELARELPQIVVPGDKVLQLEPGHYTIFHEHQSTVDGRIYSGTDVTGLLVRVEPAGGGEPLALAQPSVTSSYSLSGRAGNSVLVFDVDKPGEYRLVAGYPQGEEKSEAVLSVGRGMTGGILTTVFSALGIAFGGIIIAVLIAVITYRRRRTK